MEHETTSIFSIWNISVYVMAGMYSGGMAVSVQIPGIILTKLMIIHRHFCGYLPIVPR